MSKSLSDKIAGILNAAPVSFDPEDDIHEETTARVVSNVPEESSDEDILSTFRKQNVDLLEDVDTRYKGKKASRRKVVGEEWSSEDSYVEDLELDSAADDEIMQSSDGYKDSDEDVSDNKAESTASSDTVKDQQGSFTHIEEPDVSNEIHKGNCIRQQLSMWENMLEMRIQLQKCLIASNKLPEHSTFSDIKGNCSEKVTNSKNAIGDLLEKLLYLQQLLLRQHPETKSLLSESGQKSQIKPSQEDHSDEEIPSDTDDEKTDNSEEEVSPKKKQKISYLLELGKRHELYKTYRDSVIQKWNNKTRIANKSGNSLHSVVKQIEHILSDKEKLIKRTQLCRIDYGNSVGKNQESSENNSDVYCVEVFDDTDFYHQLLRELIEYKSADITDPVQLGRQWIQLQSLRSKMKRKIDMRATKGRKIRYAVHSKLVNFMAPIEDITWQNDAKTELFHSLFGKSQPVNKL